MGVMSWLCFMFYCIVFGCCLFEDVCLVFVSLVRVL